MQSTSWPRRRAHTVPRRGLDPDREERPRLAEPDLGRSWGTWFPSQLVHDPIVAGGLLALWALIKNNAIYAHPTFFTSLSLDATDVEQTRLAALAMDTDAADRCSGVALAGSLEFGRSKRLADPGSDSTQLIDRSK